MAKSRYDRVIDELLVIRCQSGHEGSFDLLIRRWQHRLWQYARRLAGSDDDAWDVTQEAWLAMLRQLHKLEDPAWFAAWAFRIVQNKCSDHVRNAQRRRRLKQKVSERLTVADTVPREPTGRPVADALRRLPRDQQELLILKYGQELNIVEIAVVLGVPAGTIKSRLHNAREQLRRILEGDDP
ncbi:MAG: RNA polymerase sigma factor [Phycisphaerae bacterium]|jgi:RNA polymerase sigma-70 factor (ECF subfamily)